VDMYVDMCIYIYNIHIYTILTIYIYIYIFICVLQERERPNAHARTAGGCGGGHLMPRMGVEEGRRGVPRVLGQGRRAKRQFGDGDDLGWNAPSVQYGTEGTDGAIVPGRAEQAQEREVNRTASPRHKKRSKKAQNIGGIEARASRDLKRKRGRCLDISEGVRHAGAFSARAGNDVSLNFSDDGNDDDDDNNTHTDGDDTTMTTQRSEPSRLSAPAAPGGGSTRAPAAPAAPGGGSERSIDRNPGGKRQRIHSLLNSDSSGTKEPQS